MSLPAEYPFNDLSRANVRSRLSALLSLGHMVRELSRSLGPGRGQSGPADPVKQDNDANLKFLGRDHVMKPEFQLGHLKADVDAHAAAADTPDTLSAAVEIKFLLPIRRFGAEDDDPTDGRAVLEASPGSEMDPKALIRQAHESVAATIQLAAAATVPQRSVTLHDIVAAGRQERDFWDTHWIVKKANSALPTPAEEARSHIYHWAPVEICSPKQRLHAFPLLDSVAAVVRAIRTHHRATVNYTCDVHVHVGRADGRHLSLATLKKLATVLWLSEGQIRSIRCPSSPNFRNVFTWGAAMTSSSRLAQDLRGNGPGCVNHRMRVSQMPLPLHKTLVRAASSMSKGHTITREQLSAIHAIWQAPSHIYLGRLLSGSTPEFRRLGFNFSSLGQEDERARKGPKTIEFRVLEGTVDEEVVAAWMMICWRLVEVAADAGDADGRYLRLIRRCLGVESLFAYQLAEVDVNMESKHEYGEAAARLRELGNIVTGGLGVGTETWHKLARCYWARGHYG